MATPITHELRKRIRDAWISGTVGSIIALSKKFGVNRETLYQWRKSEGWDDERQRVMVESRKNVTQKLIEEYSEVSLQHFKLWGLFDNQIVERFKKWRDRGKLVPIDELKEMAHILRLTEQGRFAAKTGTEKTEVRDERVEIIYSSLEEVISAAHERGALETAGRKPLNELTMAADAEFEEQKKALPGPSGPGNSTSESHPDSKSKTENLEENETESRSPQEQQQPRDRSDRISR